MSNTTDLFIDFLDELRSQEIPERVMRKARECLVDLIGVTVAGAEINRSVFSYFDDLTSGKCSVIGSSQKYDPASAAFVNGFNAHTIELDDGHRFAMIHLGAVIIPAIMAVAEQEELSLKNVYEGIILGYEAAVRTAVAMQPGHKKKGFHTSGTCGTIGAAVGCAVAMGYSKAQLKSVLSAAATSAAGLLEIQEDSSQLKAYNIAGAAMKGVVSAYIGKSGLIGPDNIFGGDRGMLAIHSDTVNEEKLYEKKDFYEIERIYVKPYAACRHCHSAIEAAITLRNKYDIAPNDLESINIETYELAIRGHDHSVIKGMTSAKLSMPFSVAAAYILKTGDVTAFEEKNITDETILSLAAKVKVTENEEFTSLSPSKRIAKVEIVCSDGTRYSEQVDYAKGDPENPMTGDEIYSKFMSNFRKYGCEEKGSSLTAVFEKDDSKLTELMSVLY